MKTGNSTGASSKRRRRPRAAWAKEVRSLRDSGLSPEEFAQEKGIDPRRLRFWMRKLRTDVAAGTKSAMPAFLPVTVRHAAEAPGTGAMVMIEVDLANGRRVRMHVRPNADLKRVSDLLSAVEGGF